MSQIVSAPFVLRDCTVKLGATDTYEAHLNRVRFVPSSQTVTWQGLSPAASFTGSGRATWTCELAGVQDWETANSLAQYLTDNDGEQIPVEFLPQIGSGLAKFTGTIIAAPVEVGGEVNAIPQFTVTLGMTGAPARSTQA